MYPLGVAKPKNPTPDEQPFYFVLHEVDEARVEALRQDDEELLEFALQWLRFSLFREKTMQIRREAAEARRAGKKQAGARVAQESVA